MNLTDARSTASNDASRLTPMEARALFREGLRRPTAGFSDGWAQANLLIVPQDLAFDMLLFACLKA